MATAIEKLQNRKQALKQEFITAVGTANKSNDFTEVFKIYQQLEKIDRLEDPKKRAAYNRAVAVDTAKGLGSGFARGTTYALGLPNLAENVEKTSFSQKFYILHKIIPFESHSLKISSKN